MRRRSGRQRPAGQPPHSGRGATARGREEEDVTKAGGGNLQQVRGATARGREDGEDDKGRRGQPPTSSGSHYPGSRRRRRRQRLAGYIPTARGSRRVMKPGGGKISQVREATARG